jgi:DNA-binding NarL/FixJ family response regulator
MALFRYAVDGDTMTACLELLERAAQRVAAGGPAFIGERECRQGRRPNHRGGRRRMATPAQEQKVLELYNAGRPISGIAATVGVSIGMVQYTLYGRNSDVITRRRRRERA